ncbi:beta-ketoacyl-ACP synthase [Kovacikia minuta CCNUW1]|uniref:beta-ketoacyl-ACP synthase n=1 Tax=Kovacikia minuta TaxID=2931930 RepID=UPI001CCB479D|nr:beta-ketoacyl-ACP synthase [Kovacikia minuta]UBF25062.1 beta-ketoacyl-ACP synthase [Kovacikia minuta CCNUW1]
MDVVVTGIGLASALGDLDNTWRFLLAGESGVKVHQPFLEIQPYPLALISGSKPFDLTILTRRVVTAALEDADLVPPLPDCAVVVGSSRGNQAQWEKFTIHNSQFSIPRSPLPTPHSLLPQWLDTLPHAASLTAARLIGAKAQVLSPMAACATGLWAIAQGYQLIQSGQYQRVIAGAVEAPITPLTLAGFEQMGALARTGAYPFDINREGLVLGEGGAVLVLESSDLAKQRRAKIYGRILGFGLTADGYHVSTPEPNSPMAIAAAKQCLERSGLEPAAIDYIHAHGTATQLNDLNEANLVQSLFFQKVPLSSTKGATGHTLGASGALGVAFCLMALKHQLLPPCVGLKHPEWNLDFVRTARPSPLQTALCFSFGFGGQNAAIAIGKDKG